MAERTGPLTDVTIIDCTMALAGPFGTGLLADLGANVIKVEPPSGDMSRSVPPLPPDYANPGTDDPGGVDFGGFFASINRNKRSIVLDLKRAADRETLLKLCEQADALVENMRVGVMDRLGVGYDVIHERNPQLVYGCVRGFGDPRTGESPYADSPAWLPPDERWISEHGGKLHYGALKLTCRNHPAAPPPPPPPPASTPACTFALHADAPIDVHEAAHALGTYYLMSNKTVNGKPVYQLNGDRYLYYDDANDWIVGRRENMEIGRR